MYVRVFCLNFLSFKLVFKDVSKVLISFQLNPNFYAPLCYDARALEASEAAAAAAENTEKFGVF